MCSQSCQNYGKSDLNSEFLLQVFKWHSTYGCLNPTIENFSQPKSPWWRWLLNIACPYTIIIHLPTNRYAKQLQNTPCPSCYSPSVSVLLSRTMNHVLLPPFEARAPAYLVKTTRCSHRSPYKLEEQRTSSMTWFAHPRVKKLYTYVHYSWGCQV